MFRFGKKKKNKEEVGIARTGGSDSEIIQVPRPANESSSSGSRVEASTSNQQQAAASTDSHSSLADSKGGPPSVPLDPSTPGAEYRPLARAVAISEYVPDAPLVAADAAIHFLSFIEGAEIEVLEMDGSGWWEGFLNGDIGVFPGSYTEIVHYYNHDEPPGLDHAEVAAQPAPPVREEPAAVAPPEPTAIAVVPVPPGILPAPHLEESWEEGEDPGYHDASAAVADHDGSYVPAEGDAEAEAELPVETDLVAEEGEAEGSLAEEGAVEDPDYSYSEPAHHQHPVPPPHHHQHHQHHQHQQPQQHHHQVPQPTQPTQPTQPQISPYNLIQPKPQLATPTAVSPQPSRSPPNTTEPPPPVRGIPPVSRRDTTSLLPVSKPSAAIASSSNDDSHDHGTDSNVASDPSLLEELQQTKQQLAAALHTAEQLRQDNQQLQHDYSESRSVCEDLHASFDKLQQEYSALQKELTAANAELKTLKAQLHTSQNSLHNAQSELQRSQQELQQALQAQNALKAELDQYRAAPAAPLAVSPPVAVPAVDHTPVPKPHPRAITPEPVVEPAPTPEPEEEVTPEEPGALPVAATISQEPPPVATPPIPQRPHIPRPTGAFPSRGAPTRGRPPPPRGVARPPPPPTRPRTSSLGGQALQPRVEPVQPKVEPVAAAHIPSAEPASVSPPSSPSPAPGSPTLTAQQPGPSRPPRGGSGVGAGGSGRGGGRGRVRESVQIPPVTTKEALGPRASVQIPKSSPHPASPGGVTDEIAPLGNPFGVRLRQAANVAPPNPADVRVPPPDALTSELYLSGSGSGSSLLAAAAAASSPAASPQPPPGPAVRPPRAARPPDH